jgi:hypothetical protein
MKTVFTKAAKSKPKRIQIKTEEVKFYKNLKTPPQKWGF